MIRIRMLLNRKNLPGNDLLQIFPKVFHGFYFIANQGHPVSELFPRRGEFRNIRL